MRSMPEANNTPNDAIQRLLQAGMPDLQAAMQAGQHWKLVVNGAGQADISYILEKHGRVSLPARSRS
jgi:hypothetical protein